MEELMKSQLAALNQLFAQQLAALSGTAAPAPVAALQTTPAAPAATPKAAEDPKDAAPSATQTELKGYVPFRAMQKKVAGELTPKQEAHIRALVALNNQFYQGRTLALSIGCATTRRGEHIDDVVRRADERMYEDKQSHNAGREEREAS